MKEILILVSAIFLKECQSKKGALLSGIYFKIRTKVTKLGFEYANWVKMKILSHIESVAFLKLQKKTKWL